MLDILAPKTDAAAYNPPSDGKADVPRPGIVTKADTAADPQLSTAQANAVLKTAEAVNGKSAIPTPTPKPERTSCQGLTDAKAVAAAHARPQPAQNAAGPCHGATARRSPSPAPVPEASPPSCAA